MTGGVAETEYAFCCSIYLFIFLFNSRFHYLFKRYKNWRSTLRYVAKKTYTPGQVPISQSENPETLTATG